MRSWLVALLLPLAGCAVNPAPNPTPAPAPMFCLAPQVLDPNGHGIAGATVTVDGFATTVNADGYAYIYPLAPGDHAVRVDADGFVSQTFTYPASSLDCDRAVTLTPQHVDPSVYSLNQLAAVRGAMWPLTSGACGNLSIGPRPGQNDNVIATVFITDYPDAEQDCIIAELKRRGYTHVVMGPLVDSDGYHGMWQPNDWRGRNFDRFLDAVQKFWDNGLIPIVFLHPDNWTFEQTRDELTPLLRGPPAQKLLRFIVPSGWEPTQYGWSSCTWAQFAKWGHEVLPNALIAIHTVTDVDAPAGTDALCNDDDHAWNPQGNAGAWSRVAPFIHLWLTQSAAFDTPNAHGDPNHPEKTNFDNWQDNFRCSVRYSYCNRFHNGYAGWPTRSLWGEQPIRIIAGEYSAYWKFWGHRTEAEAVTWGDAAMAAGADGYLDSGSVPVPVR